MRIFTIIPGMGTGAEMIFSRSMSDMLERSGNPVLRYYLPSRTSVFGILSGWWEIRNAIRIFHPDVVHCHYGTVTGLLAVCASPAPVVIMFRGGDLNPDPDVSWIRSCIGRLFSQLAALLATRIICVSSELKSRLWWNKSLAVVVPTGVDTGKFFPIPKELARAKLGWSTQHKIILYNLGRAPKVKDFELAQATFAEVSHSRSDIKVIVLTGDVSPDSMPYCHNAADVLLLTSRYEGSPTILQEAIACGLPVVSVDVGDARERLAGVSMSKILPRNPVKLADGILDIIGKGARSNGPEIATREISYETVIPRVVAVLEQSCG